MSSNIKLELISGCIGGFVGQTLCYPVDTVKTCIQTGTQIPKSLTGLFRGVSSPLTSVIIEKTLLFSSYTVIKDKLKLNNPMASGLLAGVLTTLTVTPFERIKIVCQSRTVNVFDSLKIIKKDSLRASGILKSLYRGWSATLFREVPGYGIYFSVYEYVSKRNPNITTFNSFLTGSACGVGAWIVIYPSDPIKSVMQSRNIGFKESVSNIMDKHGLKGFYRGYLWGLCRAAILHGGVFVGYLSSKRFLE